MDIFCENSQFKAVEVEYWKYKGIEKEFLQDIKKLIGVVDIIFLQTDIESLNLLNNEGLEIILIYPQKNLRNEYLDRYIERDNPYDFIGTMMKYWDKTIDELSNQTNCDWLVMGWNGKAHSGIFVRNPIGWLVTNINSDFALFKDNGVRHISKVLIALRPGRKDKNFIAIADRICQFYGASLTLLHVVPSHFSKDDIVDDIFAVLYPSSVLILSSCP